MISHGKRWKYAFRAFFSLIFHGRIADDILAAFARPAAAPVVPPPPVTAPVESSDRATQLLAILQRDGRLVDFLMEDLDSSTSHLVLGHLSEHNNHPAIVQMIANEALERRSLGTRLSIATQHTPSEVFAF